MRTNGVRWAVGLAAIVLATGAARADDIADPTVLPSLVVPEGGQPLREVLAELHKAVPTFQCVLTAPPGLSADDEPRVPAMELKDVTLGQFLQYVDRPTDGIYVRQIVGPGQKAPLYAVDIRERPAPYKVVNESGRIVTAAMPTSLRPPPRAQAADRTPAARVVVLNLADYVEVHAATMVDDRANRVERATNDALSAVQAALDVAALPGPPAVIRVHPPTLTLIVRGTDPQLSLVEQTLAGLKPTAEQRRLALDAMKQDYLKLIGEQQQRIGDLEMAVARATQSTGGPATRPAH